MDLSLDTIRYFLALITVISMPAWIAWIIIHPGVRFWRRLGPVATYLIVGAIVIASSAALYTQREALFALDYGANRFLWPVALIVYGVAAFIELQCRKHLKFGTLVGMPELAKDQSDRKLLTDGIYGRMRHPRYVGFTLGYFAVALFTNYLASYVIVPAMIVLAWVTSVLEEKELIDVFGDEYRAYKENVPRFIPRLGS